MFIPKKSEISIAALCDVCVRLVTCADLHGAVQVRRGRQSRWALGPGTDGTYTQVMRFRVPAAAQ